MKEHKPMNARPHALQNAPKVLIADDDEATRILLRMALTQWGYQILEAHDGEEAWNILQQPDPPQILTLDWLMPKLDGVSLCKRIDKELGFRPYIIFLTRMTGAENVIQGLESGADEFILKPFDLAELRIRIFAGERIIKYRQQLTELNRKLQDSISNMNSLALEKAKEIIPVSDLIVVMQEVKTTLTEVNDKLLENKESNQPQIHRIKELHGKINNLIDILKGISPQSKTVTEVTHYKTTPASVPAETIMQLTDTMINLPRLEAFFGSDKPAIKEFVKTFITLATGQINEIGVAIHNEDAKSAKYFFHLLGSASGNSGMMQMYELCGQAEQKIIQSDWNAINEYYQKLKVMNEKLRVELTQLK